ncbi:MULTISPECIES: alpha/beta fold hydrolase [unclassified Stenotrophomonas]|uniref:alpha/beta hydrolase family protein n=1 Tax=unclassified Stenotrophomonas TaxID=196198 RepID=UPI002D7E2007|nr:MULTISPECIES: alpha/beta fold hydrolase [unclassified Stenotrophomonas]
MGETHGVAHTPSAAVRDAGHRDAVRYTVWYPARPGVEEQPLAIGPPGEPLFVAGAAGVDAPAAPGRWPVLLLSHGNGGSARMMGWFGTAMARSGYVVVAVDHPGNNGVDAMTEAGSILMWNRADDLAAAWAAVQADPALAPHLDAGRLGLVGYSAGGFTALVAAGARPDMSRLAAFCKASPRDGVCLPQAENAELTFERRMAAVATPELAPWVGKSAEDRAIPSVRAVFLMAPAIVQAFEPSELAQLQAPISVVVGEADAIASPATNSKVIGEARDNAVVRVLPLVGHYDFLAECTELGRKVVGALCEVKADKVETHRAAIRQAKALFEAALR